MKYFYASLIILVLLNFFFCEENTEANEVQKNEKANKGSLSDYLDSLKDVKEYTKEELREVFKQIFYRINDDPEKFNNQTLLDSIDEFSDQVFDNLADKERNILVVEDAFKKFDHKAIQAYVEDFLDHLDMKKLLHTIMNAVITSITKSLLKYFGDEDL